MRRRFGISGIKMKYFKRFCKTPNDLENIRRARYFFRDSTEEFLLREHESYIESNIFSGWMEYEQEIEENF